MGTSRHAIEGLFMQLGLSSSEAAIEAFISNHHLPTDTPLKQAPFWSVGQAQFIHQALEFDTD